MQANMQAQMRARQGRRQQHARSLAVLAGAGPRATRLRRARPISIAQGAVKTFLDALEAKDLDRLSEATALGGAQVESATREPGNVQARSSTSRSRIPSSMNWPRSSRVTDQRREPGQEHGPQSRSSFEKRRGMAAYSRRRITARHEKKGWGVLDISR